MFDLDNDLTVNYKGSAALVHSDELVFQIAQLKVSGNVHDTKIPIAMFLKILNAPTPTLNEAMSSQPTIDFAGLSPEKAKKAVTQPKSKGGLNLDNVRLILGANNLVTTGTGPEQRARLGRLLADKVVTTDNAEEDIANSMALTGTVTLAKFVDTEFSGSFKGLMRKYRDHLLRKLFGSKGYLRSAGESFVGRFVLLRVEGLRVVLFVFGQMVEELLFLVVLVV